MTKAHFTLLLFLFFITCLFAQTFKSTTKEKLTSSVNTERTNPNWQPVYYTNSTTVYATVTINSLPAQNGDIVAAFVNNECRAVSNVVMSEGTAYVSLLVNGESIENAYLRVWDSGADVVCSVLQPIVTNPGNSLGEPPNYISITAVTNINNNTPTINLPPSFSTNEDSPLFLNFSSYLNDQDNDPLVISCSNNNHIAVTVNGNNVSLVPQENWNGNENLTFTVFDGIATASDEVQINVSAVNDAPVLNTIGTLTLNEDTPLLYTIFASDVDNSVLSYNATVMMGSISAQVQNTNQLILTPATNWNGAGSVRIRVSDGILQDSLLVNVTVTPVNDPPVLVSPFNTINLDEDFSPYSMDLSSHFSDIDNTTLSYTAQILTGSVNNMITNNNLVLSPVANWNGTASVRIICSDGQTSINTTLFIQISAVNDAPTLTIPATYSMTEDVPALYDLSPFISDVDNTTSNLTMTSTNSNHITVTCTGFILHLSSTSNWNGIETITISVSDNVRTISTANIVVNVAPVNDAPVINEIAVQNMQEDTPYSFQVNATDVDNTTLAYSASVLAGSISVSIQSTIVTITPQLNWNGQASIKIKVSDAAAADSQNVVILVAAVNDAPTIELPPSITGPANLPIVLNMGNYISDIDTPNNQLSVSVSGGVHTQASINGLQVTLTCNTQAQDISEDLTFIVNDGNKKSVYNVYTQNKVNKIDKLRSIASDIITVNWSSVANNDDNNVYSTQLGTNYPNPFNPSTTIYFSLKNREVVKITIYNILGVKLCTLLNDYKPAGNNRVVWNGKNDAGGNVASGVYFYKMQTNNYSCMKKMLLLK